MSSLRILAISFLLVFSCIQNAAAADAVETQTLGNGTLVVHIDNNGGFGIPMPEPQPDLGRFRMIFNGIDQFGEGSLILTDGQFVFNGRAEDAFNGTQSGMTSVTNAVGFGLVDAVTGSAFNPYTPVSFNTTANNKYMVAQSSFAEQSQQYIIYVWKITNVSGLPFNVAKAMFLIDWDLGDSEADSGMGWDASRRMVYQRDGILTQRNTTAGQALLWGSSDNFQGNAPGYHLGLFDENDPDPFRESPGKLLNYFQDPNSAFRGGMNDSLLTDKIVGVSADLGNLSSGHTACVAFVQAIAEADLANNTQSNALDNLRSQYDRAVIAYNSIPAAYRCGIAQPVINAGMNSAWVNPNAPLQGHFLTVYPDAGLIFQSWFTFDSVVQAQAMMQSEGPGTKLEQAATFGADDQRWVTALGAIDGNKATLTVENTSGGIFNDNDPVATQDTNYGTITLEFLTCVEAIMTYDFPSVGLSGTDTLVRAVDDSELCEMLASP
ncbi:MAG: hypothetical protein HKO64_04610 [Xanthomonadales bacterium]|nr:hypothetical protein [Gammaproteobacteria bacterium]NNL94881.1 hypothetical protein [Xanthomonadales bacterium]